MAISNSTAPDLGCWVCLDPTGVEGEWLVAIEVNPKNSPSDMERAPLDLMLVVDRSSSMVGSRIAAAVEATRQIIRRLNESDRVGVVAFDSKVQTVRRPGSPSAETASDVAVALTELGVGYGTNISAAWRRAADLITRGGIPGASKTILLLTDGLPSRGIRKTYELEDLVQSGADLGIVTSTVGIGDRFDERLLSRMARAGCGVYRFAERDEDTIAVADEEVEGLKGLVAESVVLHVGFARAVHRYEVLHELTCRSDGDGLAVELGRLFSVVPRNVLIQLVVEPGTRHLGAVGISCVESSGGWSEAGPARILLPAPGQEARDIERVGAAYVPLKVAQWQQRIWERGRDASSSRLLQVIDMANRELSHLPEAMLASEEAREAIERHKAGCLRITEVLEGTGSDTRERRRQTEAAFKSLAEESTQTIIGMTRGSITGRPHRRRGWGKR